MVTLQHVLFNGRNTDPALLPLYTRNREDFVCAEDETSICLNNDAVFKTLRFDTYFNAFSIAKWKKYTNIGPVYLRVRITGSAYITLFSVSSGNDERILHRESIENAAGEERLIRFPESRDTLYAWEVSAHDCILHEAAYVTDVDEASLRPVDITVLICTYKREDYVKATVREIQRSRKQDGLADSVRVRIADNAGTLLPEDFSEEGVSIHPNLNTGGAGGFGRGMLETLRNQDPATHVLIMDDDVCLPQDVLFRTHALLRLIKDEYKDRFIGGAMLDMDRRHKQYASVETNRGRYLFHNVFNDVDLQERGLFLLHDLPIEYEGHYQAWWFSVIPTAAIRRYGMPYPFFFQMDDLEYCLRSGAKILQLNGICVWHDSFHKKTQNSKTYFIVRNALILGTLHPEVAKGSFCKALRHAGMALATFNYRDMDAVTEAFRDYGQGPDILKDGEEAVRILQDKNRFNDAVTDVSAEAAEASPLLQKKDGNVLEKVVMYLTLNGHLLPFWDTGTGVVGEGFGERFGAVFLKRRIVRVQENACGTVYTRSLARMWSSLWPLIKEVARYLRRRDAVRRAYRDAHAEMTGMDFWRRYLHLPEDHGDDIVSEEDGRQGSDSRPVWPKS